MCPRKKKRKVRPREFLFNAITHRGEKRGGGYAPSRPDRIGLVPARERRKNQSEQRRADACGEKREKENHSESPLGGIHRQVTTKGRKGEKGKNGSRLLLGSPKDRGTISIGRRRLTEMPEEKKKSAEGGIRLLGSTLIRAKGKKKKGERLITASG